MNAKEILLIGVGTAGSRAAYYVFQRGSINGISILAIDSDADALAMLPNIDTILAPAKGKFLEREQLSRDGEQFCTALKRRLDTKKLVLVVTCLGRETGNFYTEHVVRQAAAAGKKTAVIAAMPHSFDNAAWNISAQECKNLLFSLANTVLPLPCTQFGDIFPDSRQSEAYPQTVRWIAETAIGFSALFTSSSATKSTTRPAFNGPDNQLVLTFKDMPTGIFYISKPTIYNGQNLDVPTFIRKKITIDDGK